MRPIRAYGERGKDDQQADVFVAHGRTGTLEAGEAHGERWDQCGVPDTRVIAQLISQHLGEPRLAQLRGAANHGTVAGRQAGVRATGAVPPAGF